jgi:hypothetical protein
MGLQKIGAMPNSGSPGPPGEANACETTVAFAVVRQDVSFRKRLASIGSSSDHSRGRPGSCRSRTLARASSSVGACVLLLAVGTLQNEARCGEGNVRVGQEAAQATPAQASPPPSGERESTPEQQSEKDTPEASARALTSSLQDEREAVRSAAEAAKAELGVALNQARDRADTLARDLGSLAVELDAARAAASKAAEAADTERKRMQTLEQERDNAEALGRELGSLRAELDAARAAASKAEQAADTERKRTQTLEQEREQAEALGRELGSLRAELDAARAAASKAEQVADAERRRKSAFEQEFRQEQARAEGLAHELTSLRADREESQATDSDAAQAAEATKREQQLAFEREHERAERLARELASARKELDERSARLAAAYAEIVQVTEANNTAAAEQKLAVARERAGAVTREPGSVRNELEAVIGQRADANAVRAVQQLPAWTFGGAHERMVVGFSPNAIEEKECPPQQILTGLAGSARGPSYVSEAQRHEPKSTAEAKDLGTKAVVVTERSTAASSVSRSPLDDQWMLARANALLRQADISSARPFLEHALKRGSARAAFMLAETYDARVLQSWHARGISGDPSKARELYQQAEAGGIENARERIEALKQ